MTVKGASQFATIFHMSMAVPFAAVPVSSVLTAFHLILASMGHAKQRIRGMSHAGEEASMISVAIVFFGLMFVGLPIGVTLGWPACRPGPDWRREFPDDGAQAVLPGPRPVHLHGHAVLHPGRGDHEPLRDHRPAHGLRQRHRGSFSGWACPLEHDRLSDHGGDDGRGSCRDRCLRQHHGAGHGQGQYPAPSPARW